MGFKQYMIDNVPEQVFGDSSEEPSNETKPEVSKSKWQYSPNGYCEKCKVVIYSDNGVCPNCHNPTKEKYHWCKDGVVP